MKTIQSAAHPAAFGAMIPKRHGNLRSRRQKSRQTDRADGFAVAAQEPEEDEMAVATSARAHRVAAAFELAAPFGRPDVSDRAIDD
jgi:hypothetical protein